METTEALAVYGSALGVAILTVFAGVLDIATIQVGFGLVILTSILSLLFLVALKVNFAKIALGTIFAVWIGSYLVILFGLMFLHQYIAASNDAIAYMNATTTSMLSFGLLNLVWTAFLAYPREILRAIQNSLGK